jgi:hypothetical protein
MNDHEATESEKANKEEVPDFYVGVLIIFFL